MATLTIDPAIQSKLARLAARARHPDLNLLQATKQVLRCIPFEPALDDTSLLVAGESPQAIRDIITDAWTRDMLQRPGTADEFAALVAAVTMALTYPGDRPLAPTGPSSPLAR